MTTLRMDFNPAARERLDRYLAEATLEGQGRISRLYAETCDTPEKKETFNAALQTVLCNQDYVPSFFVFDQQNGYALHPPEWKGPQHMAAFYDSSFRSIFQIAQFDWETGETIKNLMQGVEFWLNRCAFCHVKLDRGIQCECGTRCYCDVSHRKKDAGSHAKVCEFAYNLG